MQSRFSTKRLSLELITTDDHAFVAELVNTEGWLEFIGDRHVHSREDAINYIKKIQNTPDLYYWVVKLKETDTPIGILSFLKRGYLDHFDIGFAFLPAFNGHGYAYEAANVVLSGAGKNSKHTTILAVTLPHNSSSIKLLTKLGLHFEKEILQHNEVLLVYSNQPVR
jgi:[ribosomal protein S5]-alanine N-acetyltransferase